MKKIRVLASVCLMVGIGWISSVTAYGGEIKKTNLTTPSKPISVVKPEQTTESVIGITFKEDEYVVIDESLDKKELPTFDKQINIMGEARLDTKISITVYYANAEERKANGKDVSKTYDTLQVGATQTFNQLIDLEEGLNRVVLKYTYKDKEGSKVFSIKKESEEEKERLKTYRVESSSAILDRINP